VFKEHDTVKLEVELCHYGLKKGDLGTIVSVCESEYPLYEVEFVKLNGFTVALTTLRAEEISKLSGEAILNSRELSSKA
jgi:hypothetical protein